MKGQIQSGSARSVVLIPQESDNEDSNRRDVNHVVAKRIVAKAKASGSAIAVEDLGGIRDRLTVRASQRNRLSGWSFHQLRSFLVYKAALAEIAVVAVDPRDTSRTCSACGHREKSNRKTQSDFNCLHCGDSADADLNAARNIRARGIVKCPTVGRAPALAYKPPALAGGT